MVYKTHIMFTVKRFYDIYHFDERILWFKELRKGIFIGGDDRRLPYLYGLKKVSSGPNISYDPPFYTTNTQRQIWDISDYLLKKWKKSCRRIKASFSKQMHWFCVQRVWKRNISLIKRYHLLWITGPRSCTYTSWWHRG